MTASATSVTGWSIRIRARHIAKAALAAPESLADLPHVGDAELESFGYVALDLYDALGAGRMPRIPSNERHGPTGEPCEEDQVDDLFPRLAAKYG